MPNEQSTALVKREPAASPSPFQPASLEQAWFLSEQLAEAQLLPTHLRNKPADVFATLLLGRDLGLTAMQAITGIHVIEGRPSVSAQTAVALVKSSPVCKYFKLVVGDAEKATYETHRVGEPGPSTMTFTIGDAQRAGLIRDKGNWAKYPAAMLRARCSMHLARDVYPDVLANILDPDEAEEIRERAFGVPTLVAPPEPPKPAPKRTAPPRAEPAPARPTPDAQRAEDEAAIEALGRGGAPSSNAPKTPAPAAAPANDATDPPPVASAAAAPVGAGVAGPSEPPDLTPDVPPAPEGRPIDELVMAMYEVVERRAELGKQETLLQLTAAAAKIGPEVKAGKVTPRERNEAATELTFLRRVVNEELDLETELAKREKGGAA